MVLSGMIIPSNPISLSHETTEAVDRLMFPKYCSDSEDPTFYVGSLHEILRKSYWGLVLVVL